MYAFTNAVRGLDGKPSTMRCEVLEIGGAARDASGADWTKVSVFIAGFASPANLLMDSRSVFQDEACRHAAISVTGSVSFQVRPLSDIDNATGWAARLRKDSTAAGIKAASRDAPFGRQVHVVKLAEQRVEVQQDPHRVLTQVLDRPTKQQLALVRVLQDSGLVVQSRGASNERQLRAVSGTEQPVASITPGSRWMKIGAADRCAVVVPTTADTDSVQLREFPVNDEYRYLAQTGRTSDLLTMNREAFLATYSALLDPEVVRGHGARDEDAGRSLVYGKCPGEAGLFFAAVYDRTGVPVYKETGVRLARLAEVLGAEVAQAMAAGRGAKMPEMPFKNYRELRFSGLTQEELVEQGLDGAERRCVVDDAPSP